MQTRRQFGPSLLAFAVACLLAIGSVRAAEPPPFTAAQLDQMLASIALFPDALLSQVLMASTYPSDVAEAVDWAYAHRDQFEGDAAVEAVRDKPWDPSVQSLVAFPQVLAMFGESPQWVRDLGDAFLGQPGEVMDSVQFLRKKAKDAGNLESNEQQIITIEPAPPPPKVIVVNAPPPPTQIITIVPASPQVVFVPVYSPVWVFGPWWHPAFPPFFYPPPPRWGWGWRWGTSVHVGIWWGPRIHVSNSLWGGVSWHRRDVNINVNRWNTINVNHRIDSRDRDVSWRHDVRNRHGTPYRDAATRDRLQPAVGNLRERDENRGRDLQRDSARQELANRVGPQNLDRDALRNIDRNQLPQRPIATDPGGNVRDRAAGIDRGQLQNNRPESIDRSRLPSPAAGADRSQIQDRAANVDRAQAQNRAATVNQTQWPNRAAGVDRSQVPNWNASPAAINLDNTLRGTGNAAQTQQPINRGTAGIDRPPVPNRNPSAAAINRDNALRGAGNAAQMQQQIDRGTASRAAMDQRASGAAGAAGPRRQ